MSQGDENENPSEGQNFSHPSYTGSMSSMICNSCFVNFSSAQEQKEHYRSEWHRHNLKRKVAGLSPISPSEFGERVKILVPEPQAQHRGIYAECEICGKGFRNQKSYEQHIRSQAHKEREYEFEHDGRSMPGSEKVIIPGEKEPVTEEQMRKILDDRVKKTKKRPNSLCLFCDKDQTSLENNVRHMAESHGLFIPDLEYLCDLEGLIEYLKEKICVGYVCLWCDGKGRTFHSIEAVQGHMLDKSHCRILYESEEHWDEFADFYDFTPLIEELSKKNNPKQITGKSQKNTTKEQDDEDDEDDEDEDDESSELSEGWEECDSTEILPELKEENNNNNNENSNKQKKSKKVRGARPFIGVDPEQQDGFKLNLKNGKQLGHGELKIYYKQKLRPVDNRAPIVCALIEAYEKLALGLTASTAQNLERRAVAQQNRQILAFDQKMGVKNNDIARKRFVNMTLQWT